MLFKKCLEKYKSYLEDLDRSIKTIEGYYIDLRFFMNYLEEKFNGDVYLEDVTIEDIEGFLKYLKDERSYKPASRKRVSSAIKTFFTFAYKKDYCNVDLASKIESIKVVVQERDYLTEDEAVKFIEAIDHELVKVITYTMFYAGLRVSECSNLKNKDVDLENRVIKVIQGKGAKDRTIPIGDKLFDILSAYMEVKLDSDYFFATPQTGRISRIRITAVIRETRRRLKWDKKIGSHTFRHSFASHLVSKDANIVSVSKLMGHSDIKVTSVYTHASKEMLEDAINLM